MAVCTRRKGRGGGGPGLAAGAALLGVILVGGGCASGPHTLEETRLEYNEVVKTTTEQQLLLNIVRLRYSDTPSSLSIANVAAQFEVTKTFQLTPFFVASGAEPNRSYTAILPGAGVLSADRPTFSLVPLDDQEFTRKLFTPIGIDGLVYLARTTWPIETVFRLYLENLNWIPNAETASGPTPKQAPVFRDFRRGVDALEELQSRGQIVFAVEDQEEPVGGPLPASAVTVSNVIEAAKNGYELRPDAGGKTWTPVKKSRQAVMYVDPAAVDSTEVDTFVRVFRLKPGLKKYNLTEGALEPFSEKALQEGLDHMDFETRSLLQALYYICHGVEIPPEHVEQKLARMTTYAGGAPFDWGDVVEGLFRVHWSRGDEPPAQAHVAVRHLGYWFYLDRTDHDSLATFSLLMELARLELQPKTAGESPVFTLPLGR